MVIAALIVAAIGSGVAAQGSGLARLSDRDDLLGWEAVGRLDMAGSGFCTGTLIAPDLVLTAAHCVYHSATSDLLQAQEILFRAGLRDGTAIAERSVAQVVAHPGFDPRGAMTMENIAHDVALLRLKSPINSSLADPFILHSGTSQQKAVSVVSYGRGRAEALSRQRSCQLLRRQGNVMAFDCNVTFGSSGAPVFAKSGNRGRIVSVVSGMTTINGQRVAVGMALPDIVAELKRELRANPVRSEIRVRRLTIGQNRNGTGAKFIKP